MTIDTDQTKAVIRQAIAERPRSMLSQLEDSLDDLKSIARKNNVPFANRAVHEAAWAMAEDEEAFWNDNWLLELPSSSY